MNVYIQLLEQGNPDIYPQFPLKPYPTDAGWDLFTSRRTTVMGSESASQPTDVHTDIAIEMPIGYCAIIRPRSSTLKRTGLLVLEGVIDQTYRGELFFMVHNLRQGIQIIEQGERLAQILFIPVPEIEWIHAKELVSTPRGDAGFGSTGR